MWPNHNSRALAKHTADSVVASGSGEQGKFHWRAIQDVLFIRPLLLRRGDIA